MLEDLDTVEWAALEHAYGSAADVPGNLRGLASADAATRGLAFSALFGSICHQGSVYPASAKALPFLIELLASEATPERDGIALLVASIMGGRGYHQVHSGITRMDPPARRALITAEEAVVREVLEHGRAAVPLLLPFMAEEMPDMRASIATALAKYPSHAALTVPVLAQALADEWDDDARQALESALAALQPGAKPFR